MFWLQLNSDGYGSHTSPAHHCRPLVDDRRPKNAKWVYLYSKKGQTLLKDQLFWNFLQDVVFIVYNYIYIYIKPNVLKCIRPYHEYSLYRLIDFH